jgi:hypothetical protein
MAFMAGTVFAQELTVAGEIKTGLYWENKKEGNKEAVDHAQVGNTDDAGYPGQGRFRLDIGFTSGLLGVKVRFEQTQWTDTQGPKWGYAYAYGGFLDEQLKLSAGRLGDSPWGTGGYEIWSNLDEVVGMRAEIRPKVLPGLNVGFVLNDTNNAGRQDKTMIELLSESVLGLTYAHDLFEIRLNYRLDSEADISNFKDEGSNFTYRVEEKVLRKLLPGLVLSANGQYDGINAEDDTVTGSINWFYIQYAAGALDAQLRTCLQTGLDRYALTFKPVISYNVTDFLTLGATFIYSTDFGDQSVSKMSNAPYNVIQIEPMLRVNFPGTYIAAVYGYKTAYTAKDTTTVTNYINLRLVYTF